MSFRSWSYVLIFGLLVTPSAWVSWEVFSSYQQYQINERAEVAQYEADAPKRNSGSWAAIMGESGVFDWLACLTDNVGADSNKKQTEYDLKAQQDMAAWAFGMLIVTVWLTVITFLGVLFVWRTLIVTRQMAADTLRIGEAQVRAYPTISFTGGSLAHSVAGEYPTISGEIYNVSPTPCFDMRVSFLFRVIDGAKLSGKIFEDFEFEEEWRCAEVPVQAKLPFHIRVNGFKMSDALRKAIETQDVRVEVITSMSYEDVFERKKNSGPHRFWGGLNIHESDSEIITIGLNLRGAPNEKRPNAAVRKAKRTIN